MRVVLSEIKVQNLGRSIPVDASPDDLDGVCEIHTKDIFGGWRQELTAWALHLH